MKKIKLALQHPVLYIVIALIFAYIGYYFHKSDNDSKAVIKELKRQSNNKDVVYRNKEGVLTASIRDAEMRGSLNQIVNQKKIDSLSKALNVPPKRIKENQSIKGTEKLTNLDVSTTKDTNTHYGLFSSVENRFAYSDKWIEIAGYAGDDYVHFDSIKTHLDLDLTHYQKRKHWYSLNYIDSIAVQDHSQYATELDVKSFKEKVKTKRFVISSGLGVGIDQHGHVDYGLKFITIGYKWFEF